MVRCRDTLVGIVSLVQIGACLYFSIEAIIESNSSDVYTYILLYFISQLVTVLSCACTRVLFFTLLGVTNLGGAIYGWSIYSEKDSFTDHQDKAWTYDVYSSTALVSLVTIGFVLRMFCCKSKK